MWSGDLFGSSEEDDQDVLLALLCKQLTEGKAGMIHSTISLVFYYFTIWLIFVAKVVIFLLSIKKFISIRVINID